MPLDEAKLGKAMYIEYYLPEDPPGRASTPPDFKGVGGLYGGRRVGQDVRFDNEGNVWLAERGFPHRLVKLDPRTGQMKDYVLPDPKNGIHEVLTDPTGMLWLPEHQGTQPSKAKRLLGFNPKTEKWEQQIPMDPDNVIRNPIKWMQSLAMDSKGNIYVGWIMGGALSKLERATNKVSVFPIPSTTPSRTASWPTGTTTSGSRSGMSAASRSSTRRRISGRSSRRPPIRGMSAGPTWTAKNNIWFGIWAAGKRPGKLAKLDQTTGRITEYTVPMQNAEPYDVAADAEDNIWAADAGQDAALWKFDTRNQTFSFYPKPQRAADTPKIQITRDGAVWYSPRGSRNAPAIGVLYPDMDKMTTLGASYVNGAARISRSSDRPPGHRRSAPCGRREVQRTRSEEDLCEGSRLPIGRLCAAVSSAGWSPTSTGAVAQAQAPQGRARGNRHRASAPCGRHARRARQGSLLPDRRHQEDVRRKPARRN